MVQFAWGLLICEGIIYLSVAERIRATYPIHSFHSFHSFNPARMPRSDAGNAEQVPLIRGAERECQGVTEMEGHKGNKVSGNKSLHGVGRYVSWGSSSVL